MYITIVDGEVEGECFLSGTTPWHIPVLNMAVQSYTVAVQCHFGLGL